MRFRMLLPIFVAILPSGSRADEKDDQFARELANIVRDRIGPLWSRVEATITLGKLGAKAQVAVPELQATLKKLSGEDTFPLQEAIIKALGDIGAPAKETIPTLTTLAGRDPDLDRHIRNSINRILQSTDEADMGVLLRLLKNRDEAQRLRAAKSLAKFGPFGKVALPELMIALKDTDADVRRAAFAAIRQIDGAIKPSDAVTVLILDLEDKDEGNRMRAVKLLGKYGKEAANAVPALANLQANDPDGDVRKAAIEAINRIGQ